MGAKGPNLHSVHFLSLLQLWLYILARCGYYRIYFPTSGLGDPGLGCEVHGLSDVGSTVITVHGTHREPRPGTESTGGTGKLGNAARQPIPDCWFSGTLGSRTLAQEGAGFGIK